MLLYWVTYKSKENTNSSIKTWIYLSTNRIQHGGIGSIPRKSFIRERRNDFMEEYQYKVRNSDFRVNEILNVILENYK